MNLTKSWAYRDNSHILILTIRLGLGGLNLKMQLFIIWTINRQTINNIEKSNNTYACDSYKSTFEI